MALFIFFGVIFSGFSAFTSKRIWQGEFQIVVDTKKEALPTTSLIMDAVPKARNILGLGRDKNALQTQVGILKSPSVLKPIFDYVND